ncbi:tetraacyldisaccharide 4'-kinase [Litorimonas sp. RW-G-Af-16]|uniref:tetraacyldisaccharide 4'-kinase n=1 Tax=Litorimonas sp. RW-G-Af-16 TaxID=3241168 RepID=UPI00390C614F
MRPPEFWNHRHGRDAAPMIRTLLKPLGWIYGLATAKRIKDTDSYDVGIPVICVGNATMGGTGKTPVASYLLQSFRRLGVEVHGLTRGYGGLEKGPVPVQPDHTATQVGDEPLLLARYAPVWVAAGRDDGARAARSHGAAVIVMDDGHQNPQLQKTLSLLVVDAEVGFGNGCVFPAGPLREKLSASLERADAVILMKPSPEYEIDDHLREQLKGQVVIPAYLAPKDAPPNGKLYAFAGIGRPNKFFDSLRRHGGNIVEEIPFADHYKYKDEDIENLFLLASEYEATLITTEKDYVRLPKGYRKGVHVWPVSVVFEDELTLRRLLHPIIAQTKTK